MHCYNEAAAYYQVPAIILRAIHGVERGKRGDRIRDPNGTFDHGFMQINTCWKSLLHEQGWTMHYITNHDCANIFAAAWILRQHLNENHDNLWLSVAEYNSGDLSYGYPYAKKVYYQLLSLEKKHHWNKVIINYEALGGKPVHATVQVVKNPEFHPENIRFVP